MSLPDTKMKKMPRNKKTAIFDALEANFAMLMDEVDGIESPLTTAYKMLHDPKTADRERVQLLQFLAPYMHEKIAQKVQVEQNTNVNINVTQQMAIDKLDNFLFEDDMSKLDKEVRDSVIEGEIVEE